MPTYFVRRRGFAADAIELQAALSRLQTVEETAGLAAVRWLHSYALAEADGRYGLACVLRADMRDDVRRHAELVGLPATEILPVAATVLLRPIPTRAVFLLRHRGAPHVAAWEDAPAASNDHTHCLRSYVVREDDVTHASVSLYQSPLPTTLADHVARRGIAAEIAPVIGRVVYRDET